VGVDVGVNVDVDGDGDVAVRRPTSVSWPIRICPDPGARV